MQWNNNYERTFTGRRSVCLLSMLIVLVCSMHVQASNTLHVSKDRYALSQTLTFLEDPVGALEIHHILGDPQSYRFASLEDEQPVGFYSPVWLKLELSFDETVREKQYVLVTRSNNYAEIKLYHPDGMGRYTEHLTGNDYLASSRDVKAPNYAFNLNPTDEPVTVYIRYRGGIGTEGFPWYLMEKNLHEQVSYTYYMAHVSLYAAVVALVLFSAIFASVVRKAAYSYYSAFLACAFMGLLTFDGIAFLYLWPDIPEINDRAQHVFSIASASFRLLAVVFFLDIARCAPRWYRSSMIALGLLAVSIVIVMAVGTSNLPRYAPTLIWALASIFGFAVCIVGIAKKQRLAISLFVILLVPAVASVMQAAIPFSGIETTLWSRQIATVGFVLHAILWSVCLAAQIRHQTESHRIALHDDLTGLPGAALLRERFEWASGLAKRQQWRMAVLFIDLDGFKAVNDTLGHSAGDRVLLEAAIRIRGALRKTDYVARMGGDEFVVLLVDVPSRHAITTVLDRLLKSIAEPIEIDGGLTANVSASIGVSVYDGENTTFPELVKEADMAMYESKEKGKNTYSIAGEQAPLRLVESHLTLVTQ